MVDSLKDPKCWKRFNCPDTHGIKVPLDPKNPWKNQGFKPPLIIWFINYNPQNWRKPWLPMVVIIIKKTLPCCNPIGVASLGEMNFQLATLTPKRTSPQICFRWFSQEHVFSTSRFLYSNHNDSCHKKTHHTWPRVAPFLTFCCINSNSTSLVKGTTNLMMNQWRNTVDGKILAQGFETITNKDGEWITQKPTYWLCASFLS